MWLKNKTKNNVWKIWRHDGQIARNEAKGR